MDLAPSAAVLAGKIRAGELEAAAVVESTLSRIRETDGDLRAFLTVTEDEARAAAARVDELVAKGDDPGPLAGIPVAVKDNISTEGIPTTAGSRMLESYVPFYDATVISRIRAAGAVIVGKTSLDEFAMGSSNENSAFGAVRNPWDRERVPGGSSGGSAVAVAAGLAGLSLGSDTGGSIRQPAAFCGVYGLKPTYGRVSRYGLIAFASSLDQIGGFARDLESLAVLYESIAGHDENDSTSAPREVEAVGVSDGGPGLRVGLASSLFSGAGVEDEVIATVRKAAETLAAAGAAVDDVELPDPSVAVATYYLLATAEASSNLARYDGVRYGLRVPGESLTDMYRKTRSSGFGPEVKRRIMLGTYVLSAGYYDAYYLKAQKTRTFLRRAFETLFEAVDIILLPTAPTTAFPLGEKAGDPLSMYLADVFTVYANLIGIPAMSVPVARDREGLPIGVQLLAPPWREDLLFRAASVLEAEYGKRADGAGPPEDHPQ